MAEEMFSFDEKEDVMAGGKTAFIGKITEGKPLTIRFLLEIDKWPKAYKHDFVRVEKNGKIQTKYVKGDKESKLVGSFVCINSKQNIRNGVICPLCEAGLKPKAKFGVPVIDRASGTAKLYESGHSTIYKALMAEFEQNGTILDVDYRISRTGSNLDTKYSVVALRKTQKALTSEELALADTVKADKYFQSKTRQEILDIMEGKKKDEAAMSEGEEEEPVPF
jgi:hypothetical protein